MGHLIQAAIAYYRATGDRKLLDGGIRFANYMVENFGPQKRPALTGHPEFEMALVELYRTTGDRRYLDFAGYLLSGVERERLHLTDDQISTCSAASRSLRARSSRATPCAPCTLRAGPRITTWKPATPLI
jgi:DUF1680 family protein